ncbi:hypothetical protein KRR37_14240 [Streptomyces sp. HNA39]|nr:hypothetical protein KRR37_14240 [Streptomyces sp. HNA39]
MLTAWTRALRSIRRPLARSFGRVMAAFLDRELLVEQWPVLRTLISRHIREVREEAFPELAQAAARDD